MSPFTGWWWWIEEIENSTLSKKLLLLWEIWTKGIIFHESRPCGHYRTSFFICFAYRPGHPNRDFHSTYALKKPQFLPNDYETRSKLSTHKYLIFTEFHNHWLKIVDS